VDRHRQEAARGWDVIDKRVHRQLGEERLQATDVIGMIVGHEEIVDFRHAQRSGGRCDPVGARGWWRCTGSGARITNARGPAGIDQKRLMLRRQKQDGRASFHIDHHDLQVIRGFF
jgi:hypothetical protein